MPAVRKPTAVLESVGAFKANPNRSRPDEPDTGRGIGPAPDHMDEDAASIWDEVVGNTAPGVFQSSDRPMMEMPLQQWHDVAGSKLSLAASLRATADLARIRRALARHRRVTPAA